MSDPRFIPIPDVFPEELLSDLQQLFDHEWWSEGRSLDETRRIVEGTQVCVGLIDTTDDSLASFTRVITDYVTFAVVLDVIVRQDLRGHGLGVRTMDAVFAHPRLQDLRGIGLQCEDDLKPFYARWGFTDAQGRSVQMKRVFDRAANEVPADAVLANR